MYKFHYQISILNFITYANLHVIEKPGWDFSDFVLGDFGNFSVF